MSTSITAAFIADYNADVHQVFQREGSMLRPAVYTKDNIVGSTAYFEKLGTGTATTKSRHGEITPMNATHTQPSCTLVDFYAGDWVDLLDEAKTNINARMAYARAGAYALGRKVDAQIIAKMAADVTNNLTNFVITTSGTVQAGLISIGEGLDAVDVPNDGMRFCALTPRAYAQAMTVNSFASADFVGGNGLPFTTGAPGHRKFRSWMGINFCMHTGLTGVGTSGASCYAWHKSSVGYASGKHAGNVASNDSVAADITWHGDRASNFVNHMMSGEAVTIDATGLVEIGIDDTGAIAVT
jgi:hypothetical protein